MSKMTFLWLVLFVVNGLAVVLNIALAQISIGTVLNSLFAGICLVNLFRSLR